MEELYHRYYLKAEEDAKQQERKAGPGRSVEAKTETHPCFHCQAHKYARMHLPIAPRCNISCNYCLRKYDCPNESRPGVTTGILKPEEALQSFLEVKKKVSNLTVAGIAGPGDALANFAETKRTLELIREQDTDITFCLSTNGLMLSAYAEELIALGVSHVTVTVNAIDPTIGARIYKYVDYMGLHYFGEAAAAILITNQLAGIRLLTARGIVCKVNIVMLKGINDRHIPEVVRKMKELGVTVTNIVPLIPVKGSAFEQLEPVSNQELFAMRKACGEIMTQMYHCRQCRADAVGTLDRDISGELGNPASRERQPSSRQQKLSVGQHKLPVEQLPYRRIAVATKSGILVDQHFGHATEFHIYEYLNGETVFREKRTVEQYCGGPADCEEKEDRMSRTLKTIGDCSAVIALRIGGAPREKLDSMGIQVFTDCDGIEASLRKAILQLDVKREII